MSTLLVEELKSGLVQGFTLDNTKRYTVSGVYPHLLVYGNPAGSFIFQLKRNTTVLFSKSYSAADMKAQIPTTDSYAHLFLSVIPDGDVMIDGGDYTFVMASVGYTFSESNYIGWCRNFEEQDYKSEVYKFNDNTNAMKIKLKINEVTT